MRLADRQAAIVALAAATLVGRPSLALPSPPDAAFQSTTLRAETLYRKGHQAQALDLLDSLRISVRQNPDPRHAADAELLEAVVRAWRGHPEEAEPHARRAIRFAQAQEDSAALSRGLRWLAASQGAQGRTAEAMASWSHLLAVASIRSDAEHEGYARLGIAYLDALQGRIEQAREGYRSAEALFRKAARAYWEAWALTAQGHLEMDVGRLDAARACHAEAAEVSRRGGVPEYEAHARNNLAMLDYFQGDPGRALEGFREARRIQRDIGQDYGALIAAENEAISLRDLGRYEEAAALMDSSLADARARGFPDLEAGLLSELGELCRVQGHLGESAGYLRRALDVPGAVPPKIRAEAAISLAATLEARDSSEVGVAQLEALTRSLWPRLHGATRAEADFFIGRWLCSTGRFEEAITKLRRADDEAAGAGFGRLRIGPLTWLAICERRSGRWDRARTHLDRASAVWEEERAHAHDPEWRERYGALLRDLMFERAFLPLAEPGPAAADARAREAFNSVQRFKARTLQERMLGWEGATSAITATVSADSLSRSLLDGDVFLECVQGSEGLVLLAITHQRAGGAAVGSGGTRLADRLARLAALLSSPPRRDRMGGAEGSATAAGLDIGRDVLDPVGDMLAGARRIIVCPDGVLCRVPFACLGGPGGGTYALIESTEVVWAPSATIFVRRHHPPASGPPKLLAFGASTPAARLPGARAEGRWLARSFQDAAFRETTAGPFDVAGRTVLHFASHSEVDDQYPWRSGIRVASWAGADETGLLRASEIARAPLDAQLVTLASCQSAGGAVISGEGVIGLTGAFLSAGAQTVVATLWPVDDRSTERLMRRFYMNLARGLTASSALRDAQNSLRRDPSTRHPFFWAGFVLVGDPDLVVPLRRRANPTGILLIMISGALVSVFAARWVGRGRPARGCL
jgi:tetratricopeptide (TPR) repeat protein